MLIQRIAVLFLLLGETGVLGETTSVRQLEEKASRIARESDAKAAQELERLTLSERLSAETYKKLSQGTARG